MEVLIVKGMGGGLDNAAIEAAKKYKYEPAKYKGKPVRAWVTVPIIFEPDKK